MNIDDNLITYLEDLSCLTLSSGEKSRLKADLRDILGYMAQIEKLDTADVPERSHPFDVTNIFRDDVAEESFGRELILHNAPVRNEEAFIAPKAHTG